MIKLLIDQGLPRSAAGLLRAAGVDALHVGDIGGAAWTDETILDKARADSRVVVTLDADFHMILALSCAISPSVIRIRIEGLRGQELADLIRTTLNVCSQELLSGAAVSVQDGRVRVKSLPLA